MPQDNELLVVKLLSCILGVAVESPQDVGPKFPELSLSLDGLLHLLHGQFPTAIFIQKREDLVQDGFTFLEVQEPQEFIPGHLCGWKEPELLMYFDSRHLDCSSHVL